MLQLEVSPNPVKENVNINFFLPENSDTDLSIIDLKGNVVDVFINEILPEGPHEFSFIIANLPEGIYFISVETGNYREVEKIIKID